MTRGCETQQCPEEPPEVTIGHRLNSGWWSVVVRVMRVAVVLLTSLGVFSAGQLNQQL